MMVEVIYVEIIKCENQFSWYFKRIGDKFLVEDFDDDFYITEQPINGFNKGYIKKQDIKLIIK